MKIINARTSLKWECPKCHLLHWAWHLICRPCWLAHNGGEAGAR